MGSLADSQRALDAEIFEDLGEVLLIGSSTEVPGVFVKRPREVGMTDGTFVGVEISFDCQYGDAIAALTSGDPVNVVARDDDGNERDLGNYVFRRRLPSAGDESGLVILELGLP